MTILSDKDPDTNGTFGQLNSVIRDMINVATRTRRRTPTICLCFVRVKTARRANQLLHPGRRALGRVHRHGLITAVSQPRLPISTSNVIAKASEPTKKKRGYCTTRTRASYSKCSWTGDLPPHWYECNSIQPMVWYAVFAEIKPKPVTGPLWTPLPRILQRFLS
ncbi:hypothetical protein E4U38_000909 [Claviceps purpurea]|nr:hypothetical protein E4U38_000909 [Claviceps purpurea]